MTQALPPSAAILIIGNEILSGRTSDANIHALTTKLQAHGIVVEEVRIVPDIQARIVDAIQALASTYTYLFTTGGIGPTHDDITMEGVAKAFAVPLVEDPQALQALEKYYTRHHLNPARRRMALVPQGATLIENPVTAAPGVRLENVFVLAGVPEIMVVMLEAALRQIQGGSRPYILTIRCEIAESLLADELAAIAQSVPSLDIGSYPTFRGGKIGLSLVVRGYDETMVNLTADKIEALVAAHDGTPERLIGY